jgi:hypothetical protein
LRIVSLSIRVSSLLDVVIDILNNPTRAVDPFVVIVPLLESLIIYLYSFIICRPLCTTRLYSETLQAWSDW